MISAGLPVRVTAPLAPAGAEGQPDRMEMEPASPVMGGTGASVCDMQVFCS